MTKRLVNAILFASIALAVVAVCSRERPLFSSAEGAISSDIGGANQGSMRSIRGEGRLVTRPGARVTLGAEVSGMVASLPVSENQAVTKGTLLLEIDSREPRARLAQARARIAEAQADIEYLSHQLDRIQKLFSSSASSRDILERSQRDLAQAKARHDEAAADADAYQTLVEKTRVVAPINGIILKRFVEQGQTVREGESLLTIADPSRARVQAEVDEFDADRITLGSPVSITVEGYSDRSWRGRVEEIPAGVVPRELKPQDPGSPTDTGVLLVKIALLEPAPFKLDQRVEVEILPIASGEPAAATKVVIRNQKREGALGR